VSELPVGRLVGLFGIRGELKCDPSSAGRTFFVRGAKMTLECADGARRDVELATVREHKGRLLVTLAGVPDATAAEPYKTGTFYLDRDRIERGLEDGEYLDVDLIGCALVAPDGTALGTVADVKHYPSSDMLIVDGRMVPMVKAFIRSVSIAEKKIVADLPPGLLDDDAVEVE